MESSAGAAFLSTASQVFRIYRTLASDPLFHPETGLGGRLLFAGDLSDGSTNVHGADIVRAANIAGAASLAAASDPAAARQAMRDSVVDFAVTSLEEALRILKNEIRKRQTVSVAVTIASSPLIAQMLDRGVLPDLIAESSEAAEEQWIIEGARRIRASAPIGASQGAFTVWTVDREPSHWLPHLDDCAREAISGSDHLRQRWLRLASRYLGRTAQRWHGVFMTHEESASFRIAATAKLAAKSTSDNPPEMQFLGV